MGTFPGRIWLGFAIVVMGATNAFACSCWHPEPDEYLSASNLIFRGKVISVKPSPPLSPLGPGSGSTTLRGPQSGMTARFEVDVSYKGQILPEVEVAYTSSDGANCGWGFVVGDEVTVFAAGNSKQGYGTSMCLMIPYASYTRGGDNRYQVAIDGYRERRAALNASLQQHSSDQALLEERAVFFSKYHDYDDAEAAFSLLLAVNPRHLKGLVGRGDVRYALTRYEDALLDYRAAMDIDQNGEGASKGKAKALVKLGRVNQLGPSDRNFSGFDSGYLSQPSFAGLSLEGANFHDAHLSGVNFSGADLRGADFSDAYMHSCDFSGAKLAGAKFQNLKQAYQTSFRDADLDRTDFRNARLFHVTLDGAHVDGADFSGAKMESVSLASVSVVKAKFAGASFIKTSLQGAVFVGQDISNADFRGTDLRETIFRRANLNGAKFGSVYTGVTDLRGADLSGATLDGASWGPALADCHTKLPQGIELSTLPILPVWGGCPGSPPKTTLAGGHKFQSGPCLENVDIAAASLVERDLSGFGFWRVRLDHADFSQALLVELDIQGGSYIGAKFDGAKLAKAHLSRASFAGASFRNADMTGVRLFSVDFTGADFTGANLTGFCFDAKTVWPAGFDPVALGGKPCK
jgi:uncharacterized protein YjbI with pentapeptide repeats